MIEYKNNIYIKKTSEGSITYILMNKTALHVIIFFIEECKAQVYNDW
jgi:hypothetical protein